MNAQDLGSSVELDAFEEGHVDKDSLATPPDAKVGFALASGAFHHGLHDGLDDEEVEEISGHQQSTTVQHTVVSPEKRKTRARSSIFLMVFLGRMSSTLTRTTQHRSPPKKGREQQGARKFRTCCSLLSHGVWTSCLEFQFVKNLRDMHLG